MQMHLHNRFQLKHRLQLVFEVNLALCMRIRSSTERTDAQKAPGCLLMVHQVFTRLRLKMKG